jgi:hypothetical protein
VKAPAKLTALAAHLMGKTWAHETTEQLAAALDKQVEQLTDKRVPEHLADAAGLSSVPTYQPGLIDLRGDAYDMAVYLDALPDGGLGQLG